MVAESDAKAGKAASSRLTRYRPGSPASRTGSPHSVAAPFNVKVKHLPLFPLLGVAMPGIVVKLEFSEGETHRRDSKTLHAEWRHIFQKGQKR